MSNSEFQAIAAELAGIREILDRAFPPLPLPQPPIKKLGAESISYISDEDLILMEEEELRQIQRGLIPTIED